MDDKDSMEKFYGRQSPLPMYRTKHDRKDTQYSPTTYDGFRGRSRRSFVTYLIAIFLIFLIVSYGSPMLSPSRYPRPFSTKNSRLSKSNETDLVPLEAHIMSKCPDAKDCLRDLVVPAMEKVVDKVDFRLSYIGKVDSNDTIQCMHGSTECLGNMLGLCANELYPNNTKISLGFTTCLIMSYKRIADRDLVEQCALEHGIAFSDLNACISEEGKGLDLLEASVKRSETAGVKKSCTVRMGGENWCVRDGGKWKDCDKGHEVSDLVEEIEKRYKSK